ncbi:hypothetical protein BDB00DRAFT_795158 [Zychaea mexicana]|uniref:uncharacterized protein n=1 Tax=Zychaea mexicana TaxID=64656 RepID=UPI0022FF303D|nr:uncharacterized protein BDB00DRAFT_795158 [Zychaea mexicana]KAI9499695.1 hypothetical protein BDB00DRAFT_795158 [Zychaea mexicana]
MELSVPVKAIPFHVLAITASDVQLKETVQLKPVSDATETTLKVDNKVTIIGAASVARYLIRSRNLLNEHDAASQNAARLADIILSQPAPIVQQIISQQQTKYLLGEAPQLVDALAWGVLHSANLPTPHQWAVTKAAMTLSEEIAAGAAPPKVDEIPAIPGTSPETNVMDIFKNLIASQMATITGVDAKLIYTALDLPKSLENGDLAIAVPRLRVKGNPAQFAQEWAKTFQPNDHILGATASGPFLNFRINAKLLVSKTVAMAAKYGLDYGKNKLNQGKRAIVEFSSPNIAKPFHAGHLRSTIIGAFVRNVYDANGWETIAMNYLGDWGKQYGLLAIGFARHGDEQALQNDPIKHLYDVYVSINRDAEADPSIHDEARAYFKKMEDGEEEALQLWRRFRDLSIVKYKEVYGRLNIKFDVYSGESQVGDGMMRGLKALEECGLLIDSDGAKLIDLTKYKLEKAIVQKRDGTTLYLTRDIGAALERYEKFKFDKMIYVVASQQDLHVKQLFKTLELLKYPFADKVEHVNFGMVQGMSTRKGTVVFLEDILDEAKDIMHDVMRKNEAKYKEVADPEQVADEIGLSAVKIQDNAARRIKNYEFDRNRMFTFEGDTGPYIQYAHARLMSIERKSGLQINHNANVELLTEPEAIEVLRSVAQYPDLVRSLMNGLEPCNVVTYAFKLSHDISSCFEALWVRGAAPEVADARLLMYYCARVTLGNAMRLLGLKPLERM